MKDENKGREFAYVYAPFKHEPSYWDTTERMADLSDANKAAWEETAALLTRVMAK